MNEKELKECADEYYKLSREIEKLKELEFEAFIGGDTGKYLVLNGQKLQLIVKQMILKQKYNAG